ERSDHTFLVTVGSEFPSLEKFANLFEEKSRSFLGGKFCLLFYNLFLNLFLNLFTVGCMLTLPRCAESFGGLFVCF
ncbi:TPA: hypothetical protein ACXXY4_002936, partial [Enterococcus faecium]